jgi:hypothetical protein
MSEIKKLARLGGDVRKIAALLQSKGRGRDTILAHITPQEAALLKARGGRGSTNPDTGLLEFEDDVGNIEDYRTTEPQFDQSDLSQFGLTQEDVTPQVIQAPEQQIDYGPQDFAFTPMQAEPTPETAEFRAFPGAEFGIGAPTGAGDQPSVEVSPSVLQQISQKTGLSEDFLKRLGLAGIQSIPGAVMTRRAARQAGTQRAELEAMARPYRAQAQQLTAGAQAGRLSPVAQQQLEAARAQMAQQVTGRGGVGAMQSAAQLEAFRQQLLQQQLDLGLKLSGIADRIQTGAIRAGFQADQQVQQLTSNFFNNMFRTLFGQPGQQQQPKPGQ